MNFIKKAADYDLVALGEVMLRLTPHDGNTLTQCDTLSAHVGGSELNVISAASMTGGINSALLTKFPENKLGHFAASKVRSGAVSDKFIAYDTAPGARLGVYYYEKGSSPRKSAVVYDRANSSVCRLSKDDIPEEIFNKTRIFHISSITLALSSSLRETALYIIKKMKENGAAISFDVNYRAALWSEEEARSVIEKILPMVDILFVSEETSRRMFQKNGTLAEIQKSFSDTYGCKIVATTERVAVSPTCHNFGSVIYFNGKYYSEAPYEGIDVIDRIGSGDAYVGGVLSSLLKSDDILSAVSHGNALAALKSTVIGDMAPFTASDVENVIASHKKDGPQDEMVR